MPLRNFFLFLTCCFFLISFYGCAQDITLTSGSNSQYMIITPKNPSKVEQHAAHVLQDYIARVSGYQMAVVEEGSKISTPAIYIGYTSKKDDVKPGKMPAESYLVQTLGKNIVICGGSGKGLVYGVYHFIETYLHCSKLADVAAVVPEYHGAVALPGHIHDEYRPVFTYREAYFPASHDAEYLEWHQLQQLDDLWGLWGHSFRKLVPAETFFTSNPEYFALVNGKRQPSQLCLSNNHVFDLVVADLKRRMAKNPDALYWSVSPNDDNGYCQCDQCRRIDAQYGGPSGSLIKFVNKVAAAFPDKIITTLAYGYTHKAPQGIKPADNVYVFLSDIDAYRDKPLTEEHTAEAFRKDLSDWGALTKNIFIWDYVTEFTNYLAPFPDVQTLQPNIKYFRDNGVKGIFEQGSGDTYSDWAELKSYLIARLMENPDVDVNECTTSFFNGYFGAAGRYLQQYFTLVHDKMVDSHRKLDIYGNPVNEWNSYLTPELLDQYSTLLDKAEAAAEDNPMYLARVVRASLTLEYTVLQQARFYGVHKFGIFVQDKNGAWNVKPKFDLKVSRFVANCKKAGITELAEDGMTPDQYQTEWDAIFRQGVTPTKALNAPVKLQYPFAEDYPARGPATLTDGNPGYKDFSYNWLCFYGVPMVATIDLGKPTTLRNIKMHFLDDPRHWIFLPEKVTIELSDDGVNFHDIYSVSPLGFGEHYDVSVKEFTTLNSSFKGSTARYIRVTAKNLSALPPWRMRDNKKPMLACDEIYVE